MPGWLGARLRGLVGLSDLVREVEATKLRVRLLEQDMRDSILQIDELDARTQSLGRVWQQQERPRRSD